MSHFLLQHLPPTPPHLASTVPSTAAPVFRVGEEGVWEAIIGTVARVRKTPWKDGKGSLAACEESAVQFRVQVGSPGKGIGLGEGRRSHDVEGFAEVGRVFVKVHQRAVERKVGFV